jgi:hypothetical protein
MKKFAILEKVFILTIFKIYIGSFGIVSKVRRKKDGKEYVWKELNYGKMSEKEK